MVQAPSPPGAVRPVLAVLGAAFLWAARSPPAAGGVSQRTVEQAYWVSGTTPQELVGFMVRHPTRGDHGAAWANIRPDFRLSLRTRQHGGCAVSRVDLHIDFTMTLPRGRSEGTMGRQTRKLWRSFAKFARNHEFGHRRIYLDCAKAFAARARKLPPMASCHGLQAAANQLMRSQMAACEPKHQAFDRREAGRLRSHPLLRAAKSSASGAQIP